MPKRRLPGGASEARDSSSTQGEANLQRNQQPASSRSSRKRISDVFSKLADGCNKHSTYHQTSKRSVRQDEDEENVPEQCRKDLISMKALLPKVEKCFQASNSNQQNQVEATDVAHLCDFYERVLRGVYCPHSPALFKWGKVPKDGKKKPLINFCCFCQSKCVH